MGRWISPLVAALILLAGCGGQAATPPQETICTLIGCSSGLTVQLQGNVPASFLVTVTETGGEEITFTCRDGQFGNYVSTQYGSDLSQPDGRAGTICLPDGFMIAEFMPQEVAISIEWDGGTASETAAPTYQTLQPNGPNCPPTCEQATLTMEIP